MFGESQAGGWYTAAMAKQGRRPLSGAELRVLHTKQKSKPRFVTKAHRLEQQADPLAYDDVRKVLQRAGSGRKEPKA